MKKIIALIFTTLLVGLIAVSFTAPENIEIPNPEDELDLGFPEEVQSILKTSCFDCHTAEATSSKAKSKLNFSKWDEYKVSKKIGKLDAICEEVHEGSMPTEKYLKHYPEKALTEAQIELICTWVDEESSKLMEE